MAVRVWVVWETSAFSGVHFSIVSCILGRRLLKITGCGMLSFVNLVVV